MLHGLGPTVLRTDNVLTCDRRTTERNSQRLYVCLTTDISWEGRKHKTSIIYFIETRTMNSSQPII